MPFLPRKAKISYKPAPQYNILFTKGLTSACGTACACIVWQILIALMFWCRGKQIHRANCQNTSSSSSTGRLEGTYFPLLLWWFNNSKQVCILRSDATYFLLSQWETRGCMMLSEILLSSNSLFLPWFNHLQLVMFLMIRLNFTTSYLN